MFNKVNSWVAVIHVRPERKGKVSFLYVVETTVSACLTPSNALYGLQGGNIQNVTLRDPITSGHVQCNEVWKPTDDVTFPYLQWVET